MKRYQLNRPGSIAGLDVVDVAEPRPGRGEVLVRMRATSLNYRDLMMVKGTYEPPRPGLVPLSDGAGDVAGVGEGVRLFTVGDRVCPIFRPDWAGGPLTEAGTGRALGGTLDGVLSEWVVVPDTALVRIPDHLSFEEAATLPCAAVTAWYSLVEAGGLAAGETVLIQGTGGVSIFALQFAKLFGARAIGTSSSDEKLGRARALGLDDGINYRAVPEWQEAVLDLTDGRGVDHVVEVGGAGTLQRSMQAARVGGSIGIIGVLTGRNSVDPFPVLRRGLRLHGVAVGSRGTFEAMNRAIALHGLRPVIDRVFPFEAAPDAWRHLEGAGHFGKIVITM